jgi:O-methyltransferase
LMGLWRILRNGMSSDPGHRLVALHSLSKWLFRDYRLTWHQLAWWGDPQFNDYLSRFGESDGFNTYRKWTLWQLLRLTLRVEGDTAECGVFEGGSSWLICAWNAQNKGDRQHHLFDSFEGVSAPMPIDGTHWRKGDLCASQDLVLSNLQPFARSLHFHKGWIPERFADVANSRFAFVHVDVDLYEPTRDSVAFFYHRLSPGAVFLCDDYGFTSCPGATMAIDQFLADKPEKMLALPTGGGFLVRGCATSSACSPLVIPEPGP